MGDNAINAMLYCQSQGPQKMIGTFVVICGTLPMFFGVSA